MFNHPLHNSIALQLTYFREFSRFVNSPNSSTHAQSTHLTGLGVFEELEIHGVTIGEAGSDLRHHVEEHTDGVTSADRVPVLLEVGCEPLGVQPLNDVHSSMVKCL